MTCCWCGVEHGTTVYSSLSPGSSRQAPGDESIRRRRPGRDHRRLQDDPDDDGDDEHHDGGRGGHQADPQPAREPGESGRRWGRLRLAHSDTVSDVSTASEASPPPPPAARRQTSRALDVLTAVLLGIVSLTTALGAWQATTWTRQAADYGESSADARDQNITRSIDWQGYYRLDNGGGAAGAQVRAPRGRGERVGRLRRGRLLERDGHQLPGPQRQRRACPTRSPTGARRASRPTSSPTSDPATSPSCAVTPIRTRSSPRSPEASRTRCRPRRRSSRRRRWSTPSRCSCWASPASTGCARRGSPPSRSAPRRTSTSLVMMAGAY